MLRSRSRSRGGRLADAIGEEKQAPKEAPNPLDTGEYSAPVMTQKEFDAVALPLAEAPARLRATLEERGFAVVTGVVPAEELGEFEHDFLLDLEDLVDTEALQEAPAAVREAHARFAEGGPRLFPLRTALEHLTAAAGFVLEHCLAHGRFAWRARRHPGVRDAFRAVFPDAAGLVGSLDVTFFTPGGQAPAEHNHFSAHTDQNLHDVRPGLAECETYQGVLYIWPAAPDGRCSTTVVWPRSHKSAWRGMMDDASFRESGRHGLHYSEVAEMQDREAARAVARGWVKEARRVQAPAGSLLLWNSRTLHTGWRGGPRLAQAVCLEPVERRSEAERAAKLRLAALGLPGCHWASAAMQHDMSLGAPGCFDQDHVGAEEGDGSLDSVVLPLRPAMRPAALRKGANMRRLVRLVRVPYQLCGMWSADAESSSLLEESVAEEFKQYL